MKKVIYLVARGRFELPSAGPEPAMIDRYTTGLNVLLCYRKVSLLLNKSLITPFSEANWMKKGVSIPISSLDVKYRAANRVLYCLRRILDSTRSWRNQIQTRRKKTLSTSQEGNRKKANDNDNRRTQLLPSCLQVGILDSQ